MSKLEARIQGEKAKTKALIMMLLGNGWRLSVHNGGYDYAIEDSVDLNEILNHATAADEARIEAGGHWVYLVFGNSVKELIADYSPSLEAKLGWMIAS